MMVMGDGLGSRLAKEIVHDFAQCEVYDKG